ncbi:hypothetical protein DFH09DRAFT_1082028 [Mycena vulgaris]|nr:hypothetical protein DFH09DRAFT_1082028 [Mycena vulgaris]
MAVYYNEYGEYDAYTTAYATTFDHQDLSLDTAFYHGFDPVYELSAAEYYDIYGDPAYGDAPSDLHDGDLNTSPCSHYEEETGTMQIAYGEPGYWDEYHRRRYEIIYGSDCGEEELPETSCDEYDDAVEVPGTGGSCDVPNVSGDCAASEWAVSDGAESEAIAWEAAWERGPLIGENELDWAVAMDAWRQRIEADEESCEEDITDDFVSYAPAPDEESVHVPALEYLEDHLDAAPAPLTLEELQASYDRGEIPEDDRDECARLLGELWVCELEDQRLIAAGYVWNEELGDYVHPAEADSSVEYESDEADFDAVCPLGHTPSDIHHRTELAPPIPVPHTPITPALPSSAAHYRSPRPGPRPKNSKFSKRPLFPRAQAPFRRQSFIPRAPPPLSKSRPKRHRTRARASHRDLPPHLDTTTSPPAVRVSNENADATVPASSATPPPIVDESRCSPDTVPAVAADVLVPEEPVPPDIAVPSEDCRPDAVPTLKQPVPPDIRRPTASETVSAPSKDPPAPDVVLIPRQPGPPNIAAEQTTTPAARECTSVAAYGAPIPVPKPPNISSSTISQLKDRSASAQRRRNAQRRIARKGKG